MNELVVVIACKCDAKFEVGIKCTKLSGDIVCENCGSALPKDASEKLRAYITAYFEFSEAISKVDLYEYKII